MIVINARFLTQNLTGVQRYGIEISVRLKKMLSDIVFVSPKNIVNTETAAQLEAKVIGTHTGHLWEQVDLPIWLKRHGNPLLVNFANTAPVLYNNKIVVLHDITFIRYPNTFSWKFRTAYKTLIPLVLKSSKHVISVSQFSVNEISSYYGYPKEKMSVVYSSMGNGFKKTENDRLKSQRYFFAVSSVKENKNFLFAMKAFKNVCKHIDGLKFFIAGDLQSSNFGEIDIDSYRNDPTFNFLGRISDEELISYYSNATAFVFPSLYEGFGLPPLEAQACGCPAICAQACSLPEVYGDSVLYCDPHDLSSLEKCMEQMCDEDVRKDLIKKGYENIKRYGFDKSTKKMYDIIRANE